MLVKWTKSNVLTVCLKGKNPREITTVQILPGVNEIDDAMWKRMLDHQGLKHYLSDSSLVERKGPSKDNKKSGKGLTRFGIDEAKELIGETLDKLLLAAWKEDESRADVLKAIDKQIKHIDDSVTLKDVDDDDDED